MAIESEIKGWVQRLLDRLVAQVEKMTQSVDRNRVADAEVIVSEWKKVQEESKLSAMYCMPFPDPL